jgi:hypothetical protein
MLTAANNLEFEKAALLRDQVRELKRGLDGSAPARDAQTARPKPVSYSKSRKRRGTATRDSNVAEPF